MSDRILVRQPAAFTIVGDTQGQPVALQLEVADVILADLSGRNRTLKMVNHYVVVGFKRIRAIVRRVAVERSGLFLVRGPGTSFREGRAMSPDDMDRHVSAVIVRNHSDSFAIIGLIKPFD